jgi:hypothetical protein
MPFDIDSFAAAVEDTLPCVFDETTAQQRSTFLAGPDTRIVLDAGLLRLEFTTPVEGAHDGLPADALLDLLRFNFPNDLTRGSFLSGGRGAGHLALTASLPLEGASAEAACNAILDQIAAAIALGERLVQRRTGPGNKGSAKDVA